MKKIKRQIAINVILIVLSIAVIIVGKSYAAKEWLSWKKYLGTDVMLMVLTSLITIAGWRVVEEIRGHWIWNIVVVLTLIFMAIIYGMSMVEYSSLSVLQNGDPNDVLVDCICVSVILFLIFSFIEYMIIIIHFRKNERRRNMSGFSYSKETRGEM